MEIVNLYIGGGVVVAVIQATVIFTSWIAQTVNTCIKRGALRSSFFICRIIFLA